MTKSYQHLIVERRENYVVHVQLNRPKQLNALNLEIWQYVFWLLSFTHIWSV